MNNRYPGRDTNRESLEYKTAKCWRHKKSPSCTCRAPVAVRLIVTGIGTGGGGAQCVTAGRLPHDVKINGLLQTRRYSVRTLIHPADREHGCNLSSITHSDNPVFRGSDLYMSLAQQRNRIRRHRWELTLKH
jgi:hypothetical protein